MEYVKELEDFEMKNFLISLAVVIVLAAGAWFLVGLSDDKEPSEPGSESTQNVPASENEAETISLSAADRDFLGEANIGESVDATGQSTASVTIDDQVFEPTLLIVSKGTKVTWTNEGNISHNIVSDSDSPNSFEGPDQLMGNGDIFEHTFTETGTFYYYCGQHPEMMRGIVKVVD